jgi:hypothetical protein
LRQQALNQFLARAHRQRGNVVDGFVRVQLGTLAARVFQRVNHMCLNAEQAQLEHLEQTHRTGTDDDGVGFYRRALGHDGII